MPQDIYEAEDLDPENPALEGVKQATDVDPEAPDFSDAMKLGAQPPTQGPWNLFRTAGGPGPNSPLPQAPTQNLPPTAYTLLPAKYIDAIKQSEGDPNNPKFYKASWDVKQHSIGYGTKAKYPGETADLDTLTRRFDEEEFPKAYAKVDEFAPDAPTGVKAALTSLTYNAGEGWMTPDKRGRLSGLAQAIQAGDYDRARRIFLTYNKSGGQLNAGLAGRRLREAQWFGDSDDDQMMGGGRPDFDVEEQPEAPPSGPPQVQSPGQPPVQQKPALTAQRARQPRPAVAQPQAASAPFNPFSNTMYLGGPPAPEGSLSIDDIIAADPEDRPALLAAHLQDMAKSLGVDLPKQAPRYSPLAGGSAGSSQPDGPWKQFQTPETNVPGPGDKQPVADTKSSIWGTALEAGRRGLLQGLTDTAQAVDPFKDRAQEAVDPNDHVSKLLSQSWRQGWSDPQWWVAQVAHSIASSSPSLALGAAGGVGGGAAGTAIAGPPGTAIGTVAGGAAGFALGSAIQTIAPAYRQARAEGLDHDAAVDRAIKVTGIATAFGAAMGLAPGVSIFGTTAEGALKRPISEALAQIFGVMPGIGAAQQAVTAKAEGKDVSLDDLLTGFVSNAAMGGVLVGAHGVWNSVKPGSRIDPRNPAAAPPGPNPYDVLGIKPDATEDEIKAAFHQRAMETHPDRGGNAADFDQVAQAYKTLKDPDQKARWDAYGASTAASPSWLSKFRDWFGRGAKGNPPAEEEPTPPQGGILPGSAPGTAGPEAGAPQPPAGGPPAGGPPGRPAGSQEQPVSAEPAGVNTVVKQTSELSDPDHPRQAVYVPREAIEQFGAPDETGALSPQWRAMTAGYPIQVDGGMILAKDHETQQKAQEALDKGQDPHAVVQALNAAQPAKQPATPAPEQPTRAAAQQPTLATPQQPTALDEHGNAVPVPPVRPYQPTPASFETAKGSTYQVQPDGTTIRDKAARDEPGHEGQQGIQPQSEKTFYVAPEDAQRLAMPEGHSVIVDHKDGTLSVASLNTSGPNAGKWGISPESKNVPVSNTPELGKQPVELWKKSTAAGLEGHAAYQKIHLGNEITKLGPETGSRGKPVKVETAEHVQTAGARAVEPTEAQAEAGNYRKGHIQVHDLNVTIETPKGGIRRGKGWENKSPAAYGYIKGVPARSKDKEHVDVYVGDHPESTRAFVVNQHDPESWAFDEAKVILGARNADEATKLYDAGFSDHSGPSRRAPIVETSIDQLKDLLLFHDFKKPVDDRAITRAAQEIEHAIVQAWRVMREQQEREKRGLHIDPVVAENVKAITERLNELGIPTDPEAPVPSASALRAYIARARGAAGEAAKPDQGHAPQNVQDQPEGGRGQGAAHPEATEPGAVQAANVPEREPAPRESAATPSSVTEREHAGSEPAAAARPEPGRGAEPVEPEPEPEHAGSEPAAGTVGGTAAADHNAPSGGERAGDRRVEKPKYEGPELDEAEIATIVGFWKYIREVDALPQPQSLTDYIIKGGGLNDEATEVRHIAGAAKERPGLVNKDGSTLDDAALRAWEQGFFPDHTERPTISEFLDKLQEDLHTGLVVRDRDQDVVEGIRWADQYAEELADYGITAKQFSSERALRSYLTGEDHEEVVPTERARPVEPVARNKATQAGEAAGRAEHPAAEGENEREPEHPEREPGADHEHARPNRAEQPEQEPRLVSDARLAIAEALGADKGPAIDRHIIDRARAVVAGDLKLTGTEHENLRKSLDKVLADAVAKAGPEGIKALPDEIRTHIADKILPSITNRQRATLARGFGVDDTYPAVEAAIRGQKEARETGPSDSGEAEPLPADEFRPAVPIKKSITETHLISLITGEKFKQLKRHLQQHGLTPEQYRERYGLPADYPMVHPSEEGARARLGKGLADIKPTGGAEAVNTVIAQAGGAGNLNTPEGKGTAKEITHLLITRSALKPAPAGRQFAEALAEAGHEVEPFTGKNKADFTDWLREMDVPRETALNTALAISSDIAKNRPWYREGLKPSDAPAERIGKVLYDAGYTDEESAMKALTDATNRAGRFVDKLPPYEGKSYLDWYKEASEVVPSSEMLADALSLEKAGEAVEPVDAIKQRLLESGFKNILEARKFAKDAGFEGSNKAIDELVEQAVVKAARTIAHGPAAEGNPDYAFKELVRLYNNQPNLAARTSTSVANQAYSTPVPLAYLASRLVDIDNARSVYEPTAGNGALLVGAHRHLGYVWANEIDPKRAEFLKENRPEGMGDDNYVVSTNDATEPHDLIGWKGEKDQADAILANPPFGAVREKGQSKTWDIDGFKTSQVDHAIALRALDHLADDGKAVLILGSVKAENIEERRKGYRGDAKRKFFTRLYKDYNVVDHFTVDGDLYKKQGAGWPVDVVVIHGRGKSELQLPAANPPPILKSWDALAEKLPHEGSDVREAGQAEHPANAATEGRPEPAADHGVPVEAPAGRGSEPALPETERVPAAIRGERHPGEPGNVRRGERHAVAESEGNRNAGGSGAPAPAEPQRPRVKRPPEQAGTGQAQYEPVSRAEPLDTLVPTNMASAAHSALERVEKRHGSLDKYTADRLGYESDANGPYFMRDGKKRYPFSAEQIDALSSAIDNIEKGDAFVLGDQTGIGKGRVAAGVLRYALKHDMIPVFITEKPDLYGDMYRDMNDIGMPEDLGREPKILITNADENIPLDDEALAWKQEYDLAKEAKETLPKRRGKFLSSGQAPRVQKGMKDVLEGAEGKPDIVFSTYSQMQTVGGGKTTDRRGFLRTVAPRALFVMDESHNAGGVAKTGWEKKDKPIGRSDFARELAKDAKGVMFSSATYAKSPDVMDLYARTDMGKAVDDPKELPELIKRGGLPMQQIVASMLADSGQYLRRERSFAGVDYAVKSVPVDLKAYKQFSDSMRAIFRFDLDVEKTRDEIMKDILDEMGYVKGKDTGVGEGGASTTAFGSVMHNIVNQMLLAIKAEQAARAAIEAHKAGERPIIALANTNESFIKDFADAEGYKLGDGMGIDFGDVLRRYLSRTLRVTVKKDDDTKVHVQIPVEKLPGYLQKQYRDAEKLINSGEYGSLPISPIDWIRHRLRQENMTVAEVTGRKTMLDYGMGNEPKLSPRPKREIGPAGKRGSIAAFNRGALDALILNRSGSTGVSMHASRDFKDQRKRRMILAQPEANIDTHLQMLGRVHRTGQVQPPAYSQLAAEIPAEARPTAVLMKKMASLNANTTGARSSAFMAEATDFMNEVGDKVIARTLAEDPTLNRDLGDPLYIDDSGKAKLEDLARKATGRLTLLDPERQQEFLDKVTKTYQDEITQLDQLGENPLEAKTLDLQAKTIGEPQVLKPRQGDSPFTDEVRLEKISAKAQGRAMAPGEVVDQVSEFLKAPKGEGEPDRQLANLQRKGFEWSRGEIERVSEHVRPIIRDEIAKASDDAKASTRARLEGQLDRWRSTMAVAYPGGIVKLGMPSGGELHGVVMSVERTGNAKAMMAPSAWRVKIAVPDSARVFDFPMSKLYPPGMTIEEGEKGALLSAPDKRADELFPDFEDARKEGREERFVFTGNVLAAYEQTHGTGRIVNFTDEHGKIRPGILMSRGFGQEEAKDFMNTRAVRMKSGEEVAKFLDQAPDTRVTTKDRLASIYRASSYGGNYVIDTDPGRGKGGRYYTDPAVMKAIAPEEFRKTANRMKVQLDRARFVQALDAMRNAGALFEATEAQELATKIVGEAAPKAPEAAPAAAAQKANVPATRTKSAQAIDDLADSVDGLKDRLGIKTRPRQGPARSITPAKKELVSLKDTLAQIQRGSRLDAIANHVASFIADANDIIATYQKHEDVDLDEVTLPQAEKFLNTLSDLGQIMEQRSQDGYKLTDELDEARDLIDAKFDELRDQLSDIQSEAENRLSDLGDFGTELVDRMDELDTRTEEEQEAAYVPKEFEPTQAISGPEHPEGSSFLDVGAAERTHLTSVLKTMEPRFNALMALKPSEMDLPAAEKAYEENDKLMWEHRGLADWASAMYDRAGDKALEAVDAINSLNVEKLSPVVDRLDEAKDDIEGRMTEVDEHITNQKELAAGQVIKAPWGEDIGPTLASVFLNDWKPRLAERQQNRAKLEAADNQYREMNRMERESLERKIPELEKALAEYEKKGPARAASPLRRAQGLFGAKLRARKPVDLRRQATQVLDWLGQQAPILPPYVREAAVVRVEPSKKRHADVVVTVRDIDGHEHQFTDGVEDLISTHALYDSIGGVPVVSFLTLDTSGNLVKRLWVQRAHEAVHALRFLGYLPGYRGDTGSVWGRLLAHADNLGVLARDFKDHLTLIGHPFALDAEDGVSLLELYHDIYKTQTDYRELMEQEAATHLMELYAANALPEKYFAPVKDILDSILSGELAAERTIAGHPIDDPGNGEPTPSFTKHRLAQVSREVPKRSIVGSGRDAIGRAIDKLIAKYIERYRPPDDFSQEQASQLYSAQNIVHPQPGSLRTVNGKPLDTDFPEHIAALQLSRIPSPEEAAARLRENAQRLAEVEKRTGYKQPDAQRYIRAAEIIERGEAPKMETPDKGLVRTGIVRAKQPDLYTASLMRNLTRARAGLQETIALRNEIDREASNFLWSRGHNRIALDNPGARIQQLRQAAVADPKNRDIALKFIEHIQKTEELENSLDEKVQFLRAQLKEQASEYWGEEGRAVPIGQIANERGTPLDRTVAQRWLDRMDRDDTLASGIPSGVEQHRQAIADANEIVRRIAGPDVDVRYRPTIGVGRELSGSVRGQAEALGREANDTVGGFYRPAQRGVDAKALIGLATNDARYSLRTSAGHEAWHHVEDALANPQERRLLNSPAEMQRMRRYAAPELGLDPNDPRLQNLDPREVRAYAFQRYRREKEDNGTPPSGIHLGIRRLWDKVLKIFQGIRNAFSRRKLGYEDVFESARTGEMARRGPAERIANAYDQVLGEVRAGERRPGQTGALDRPETRAASIPEEMDKLRGIAAKATQEGIEAKNREIINEIERLRPKTYNESLLHGVNGGSRDKPRLHDWLTPQRFLESEYLWGHADRVNRETGKPMDQAYADLANYVFDKTGLTQKGWHLTREQAASEMARQRTAGEMSRIGLPFNRGPGETLAQGVTPRYRPTTPPAAPPPPMRGRGRMAEAWIRNVQPELASDHALKSEQRFRKYNSARQMLKDGPTKRFEAYMKAWDAVPDGDRVRFMDKVERGTTFGMNDWQRAQAAVFRALLDAAHAMERVYGSTAAYVEDYLPHIWENPAQFREWAKAYIESLGPTWFQKHRTFNFITQGLAAGFKLKTTNPAELVLHRLFASADMIERVKLLRDLHEQIGVAMPAKGADPKFLAEGWQPINAPDRQRWLLAPDIQPMWRNAVESRGLWQAEGLHGDAFRAWMSFKNVWVPVKLAWSLFHPIHMLGIDFAQNWRRAGAQLWRGDVGAAASTFAHSLWDPIAAAIPGMDHLGKFGKAAWLKPESQRTPYEQFLVDRMNAGGFVPQMSEFMKSNAKRALAEAWAKSDWYRILPNAVKRGIERTMAPIFDHWIPNLKTASYLNNAAEFFVQHPEKLTDQIQYGTALSTIAKQTDNQFGEMFYNNLFWNRTMRDIGNAIMLSLGWNLGFARGFIGGAFEPLGRAYQYARGQRPSETRETIRQASTKTSNAIVYMASSMLFAGLMTKILSGDNPSEWRDYVFPKIGGKNPDGTPRRVTTMFFTREIPMAAKHIEDRGGGVEGTVRGLADMAYNKMLIQPFVELLDNKDYFGADIRDRDAGIIDQTWQFLKHVAKEQLEPIGFSSSRRAVETGGDPAKEVPLSLMGFGPAPMYAARSGLENRINSLYREYVKPERVAREEADLAEQKREARTRLEVAKQKGDTEGEAKAREELGQLHGRVYNTPYATYQFSRLPPSKQLSLLRDMNEQELKTYLQKARPAVRQKFYSERQPAQPAAAQQ